MKIRNLMTPNVESCGPHTDLSAAAMVMWRQDCGIVPVVNSDRRVVGVITDRDICMAVATRHRPPETVTVGEVISGRLATVRPDDDATLALETMRTERVRRLPVVDTDGRLQGIVSINDLVLHTEPGARHGSEITLEAVLQTMKAICEHPVPMRSEGTRPERPEAQLSNAF